jgi:DNA polymerase
MRCINVDLETYSDIDLGKCGVYRYAQSLNFEILLFGYSVDGGEVQVVDLACGEKIPQNIIEALTNDKVTKWSFNCSFERICLSVWLQGNYPAYFHSYSISEDTVGDYLDPAAWKCSMIWAAYMGLPLSLAGTGAVLGLDEQKVKEGKDLIRYFCIPCKATKVNGGRTRNLPEHDINKWNMFKFYNKRDVKVEMSIQARLKNYPVPDFVWDEYHLDQKINDRGIVLDRNLVIHAIAFDAKSKAALVNKMQELTSLENPNSVMQMKQWLLDHGMAMDSLGKKEVAQAVKTAPKELAAVLLLRQQLAKSSVKKYQAMQHAACKDGRTRGMFQFYGANRSGRWAGRLIQLQNLPQNHMPDLEQARSLVQCGDYDAMELLYDDIPDTLSQLIRTAFVPRDGMKFIVADFSAIEARVLSFLAGEKWKSKAFEEGEDIYCSTASKMFGVPVEKHGVNGHLRQKGKIAELACIAEGELVLTNQGLVPIEDVTKNQLLWDGENWVQHDGVIYKGEREVIEYDGLRATADHFVWVEGKSQPVQFGIAATCGAHLLQTGNGRQTIRLGENNIGGKMMEQGDESLPSNTRTARLYDIRNAGKHHRFTVSGKLVHNCGYGGSTGALKAMGALDMGLAEEELQPLVDSWRAANPNIVRFWWDVDRCVKNTVQRHMSTETHGIRFIYQSGMLFIQLPSGRHLSYVKPRMGENRFGGEAVTYEGVGGTKKWERIESYGPKFVENIVQAISRDILAYAMRTLSHYFICGHVHDELIMECSMDVSLDSICEQMGRTPPWISGLLLRADGYECSFYKKD